MTATGSGGTARELTVDDVDKEQLEADVRKLLFSNCKDTTTWDHLGNLDPVKIKPAKTVTITEEPDLVDERLAVVPLPAGLAVLYEAAQDKAKGRESVLLYTLDVLAIPQPVAEVFDRLYDASLAQRERYANAEAASEQATLDEEKRTCTFKPTISEHASNLPGKPKSLDGFYKEALDWQEQAKKKLKKKVDKEEKDDWQESMIPWKMAKRSVALVEKIRKREQREAELRRQGKEPRCVLPATGRRIPVDELPSFAPVTCHLEQRKRLLEMMGEPTDDTSSEPGGGLLSECSLPLDQTSIAALQQRLAEDIVGRRERQEKRIKLYMERQKERQYDKVTGQPLFQPNAMPIVENSKGKKVPFIELTRQEREVYLKRWRHHRVDFIPAIAEEHYETERRDMDQIIKSMVKHSSTADKRMAKKRRKAAEEDLQECVFKPKLDKKSIAMVGDGAGRPHIGDRMTTAQRNRNNNSTREGRIVNEIQQQTPERKKKKLSQEQLQELIDRQKIEQTKEQRSVRTRSSLDLDDELTFKPKMNRVSEKLVAAAEARLMGSPLSPDEQHRMMQAFHGYEPSHSLRGRSFSHQDPTSMISARSHQSTPRTPTSTVTSGSLRRRSPKAPASGGTSNRRRADADSYGGSPNPYGSYGAEEDLIPPPTTSAIRGDLSSVPQDSGDQVDQLESLLSSWNAFNKELELEL